MDVNECLLKIVVYKVHFATNDTAADINKTLTCSNYSQLSRTEDSDVYSSMSLYEF